MKVFVEVAEAAERLEELIELAARGDEILIGRDEEPIATFVCIATMAATMEAFLELAAQSRADVPDGTTSSHDDLYDEHGLPK